MKKVIKKTVAKSPVKKALSKAKMGTAVQSLSVPKKLTRKEKKDAKEMSKYDKGRSDKPTLYLDNPYSTIKKPTDYLKKGGMAKKPMMKYGGAKKPLKKAQYGQRVYQGPLNKSDIERLDRGYPSTAPVTIPQAPKEAELIRGLNPFVNGQMVSNEEREFMQRKDSENYMRKPKGFYKKGGSTSSTKMQKGGAVKKVTAKKTMVKSKKK